MFSGDAEYPEDLEKSRRGDHTDDKAFIAKYSITLSADKHTPGQPIAPEDVTGDVTFWEVGAAFDGVRSVRGVREEWPSDGAVIESYWEVMLTECFNEYGEDDWLDENGNAVGAATVLDDNGFPFLVFDWNHPEASHGSWSGYYVGKRLVEGKDWRLTDEERGRLGIGATFRSVEQLFKEGTLGVYSDDSEEEDAEKDAGKKKKASTNETGAKKRKASTDETGAKKKKKASTDETGAEKGKANTDGTGAKRHRKRRRRRGKALMVPGPVTAAER